MNGNTFTAQLLAWYDANRRELPWRANPEPYAVWVSEIMAQQTQMDRVVSYFNRWMEQFPDIHALAQAHEEAVLSAWEGLGYYSRARNIHKAAQLVVNDLSGTFPSDFVSIKALPGVGEYTAGAISSIAFGLPEPAVDANVLRVFARLLDIPESVRSKEGKGRVEETVRALIPKDKPGDFNQALMEFGALICSRSPLCTQCPVADHCAARKADTVHLRPVLPEKKKVTRIGMATGVLLHKGRVLIQKRKPDDIWPGLWEFPGGCIEEGETPEQALLREYMEEVELKIRPVEKLTTIQYSYTRYRVTMHCFLCEYDGEPEMPIFNEAVEGGFVAPGELDGFAFPSGHRRLATFLKEHECFAPFFES